jgi:hypothetical protein
MAWNNFTFNKEEAEKDAVSTGGGAFVSKAGLYSGTIEYVELMEASTGTKGINIAVSTDTDGSLDIKQIWVEKSDGTQLSGFKTLNQIVQLFCNGEFNAGTKKVKKDKWNGSGYDQVEETVDVLKLGSKDCQVAVYPEYGMYNGKLTTKMRVSQFFNMDGQSMMEFKLGKEAGYINSIESKLAPKYDGVTPDEVEELLANKSSSKSDSKPPFDTDEDDDDLL